MNKNPPTLRPSGGYRRLRLFQVAEIGYDGTVSFCDRFVNKRSRTHDQMVQASRSGGRILPGGAQRTNLWLIHLCQSIKLAVKMDRLSMATLLIGSHVAVDMPPLRRSLQESTHVH